MSSEEFATYLFNKEHVIVVPSTAFGESGEGYIRISYAAGMDKLKRLISVLKEFA